MKILLISSNPTIEKLFTLSAEKKGDDVIIGSKDFVPEEEFEAVFIDKDDYDENFFNELKEKFNNAKFVLILSKKDTKLPGFDEYITKPFLPTDLINLLEKLPEINNKTEEKADDFDIENFDDELNLEEENFEIESLEKEEIDDFALDDLDEVVESDEQKDDLGDIEELEDLTDDVLVTEDELLENAPDSDIEETVSVSEEELLDDEVMAEPLEENKEISADEFESKELKETEKNNFENINEENDQESENEENEDLENNEENKPTLEEEIENTENIDTTELENEEEFENMNKEDIEEIGEKIEENEIETKIPEEENDEIKTSEEESEAELETEDNQQKGETMEDLELENISEDELAKALGEEIEINENEEKSKEKENEEYESISEIFKDIDIEKPEINKENDIQSKTLGSILNINWEELKKAKAKVTITIDFGD
jgi:hypothetical protein